MPLSIFILCSRSNLKNYKMLKHIAKRKQTMENNNDGNHTLNSSAVLSVMISCVISVSKVIFLKYFEKALN